MVSTSKERHVGSCWGQGGLSNAVIESLLTFLVSTIAPDMGKIARLFLLLWVLLTAGEMENQCLPVQCWDTPGQHLL